MAPNHDNRDYIWRNESCFQTTVALFQQTDLVPQWRFVILNNDICLRACTKAIVKKNSKQSFYTAFLNFFSFHFARGLFVKHNFFWKRIQKYKPNTRFLSTCFAYTLFTFLKKRVSKILIGSLSFQNISFCFLIKEALLSCKKIEIFVSVWNIQESDLEKISRRMCVRTCAKASRNSKGPEITQPIESKFGMKLKPKCLSSNFC